MCESFNYGARPVVFINGIYTPRGGAEKMKHELEQELCVPVQVLSGADPEDLVDEALRVLQRPSLLVRSAENLDELIRQGKSFFGYSEPTALPPKSYPIDGFLIGDKYVPPRDQPLTAAWLSVREDLQQLPRSKATGQPSRSEPRAAPAR